MLDQIWSNTKRQIYPRINYRLVKAIKRKYLKPENIKLEKLGSDYGGWSVPTDLISSKWICYSGGIGEDTSFDELLIKRFNCAVYGFDPTPRAIAYVEKNREKLGRQFHFYDLGLWYKECDLKFYSPKDPTHVSHSVKFKNDDSKYFIAKCKSISALMQDLGHKKIDLLKIDIEGAEYEVLKSVLNDQIPIPVICVEYDQPAQFWKMYQSIKSILNSGYKLISVDNWNFTFLRSDFLQ